MYEIGRTDHISALLPSGKLLVAGGFNTTDTGPSTELFDPASALPTPPLLDPPVFTSRGAVTLTFRSAPGIGFQVISATSLALSHGLSPGNWTVLGLANEIYPGRYQFTDETANDPQRFYAVHLP
jgi:hypothetical protein